MTGEQIMLKKQGIESPHPGNYGCGRGHVKFFTLDGTPLKKVCPPPSPLYMFIHVDLTLSPPDS